MSQFPAHWASSHFPCTGFSLCSASTIGAFPELGSCCAWPPPCGGCAEVISATLNWSHGTIDVEGVYNFLDSVLSQEKFEVTDQDYRPRTDCVTALGQISVTAQFYLEDKGKYILEV